MEFDELEHMIFDDTNINQDNINEAKKYSVYSSDKFILKFLTFGDLKIRSFENDIYNLMQIFNKLYLKICPKIYKIKKHKNFILWFEKKYENYIFFNREPIDEFKLYLLAKKLAIFHNTTLKKIDTSNYANYPHNLFIKLKKENLLFPYFSIIHGDLHLNNIIYRESNIYFIDAQRVLIKLSQNKYDDPLFDLAFLLKELKNKNIKSKILNKFIKIYYNYLKFKPPFSVFIKRFKILYKEFESSHFNFKKINKISIQLTSACNLNCNYCYQKPIRNKFQSINNIKLFFLIFFQKNLNPKNLSVELTGGEPLLNYDTLKETISFLNKLNLNIDVKLTTNGIFLNRKKIDYLVSNNVKVRVSIDKLKFNKNRYTKKIQYLTLINNMNYLLKRCSPIVRMTITPENIPTLFQDFKDLAKFGFKIFEIQSTMATQRWSKENIRSYITNYKKILKYKAKNKQIKIFNNFCKKEFKKKYSEDCSDTIFFSIKNNIYFTECGFGVFTKKRPNFLIGDLNNGFSYDFIYKSLKIFPITYNGITCGKPCYSRFLDSNKIFDKHYFMDIYNLNKEISS